MAGDVMKVDFLYYEDCPSHEMALSRLRQVMREEGIEAGIEVTKVETGDQARELRFIGSPTIRINGTDIDPPPPDACYGLTCRAYRLEDGRISPLPSPERIRKALHSAISES